MEMGLDQPNNSRISTNASNASLQGDTNSPVEDPTIGGIVNWPTSNQLATEPDELTRVGPGEVDRLNEGRKQGVFQ